MKAMDRNESGLSRTDLDLRSLKLKQNNGQQISEAAEHRG